MAIEHNFAKQGPGDCSPIVVERPDEVSWDDEADVVVVGFGGAGVVAAIEARENGATVLAIDRFSGGGATAYSGGVVYAGGGTRHQIDAGFSDTPDEMFKYIDAEGCPVSEETLRRFCEGSKEDLDWLEKNGVPFGSKVYLNKTTFPPDSYWLYFSGNERMPAFKDMAKPAPRGHRPIGSGFGGKLYYRKLRESALAKGVRLIPHAPATRLILNRDNQVVGVEVNALPESLWQRHSQLYAAVNPMLPFNGVRAERNIAKCHELETSVNAPRRIRARGGVILSTGGFIYNLELLGRHRETVASAYPGLLRLGSMGCRGDGINLGCSVGGRTDLMDKLFLGRSIAPPEAFVYGVIVNARGNRFINEDAYLGVLGDAISKQPEGGKAWLILDKHGFWKGVKQSMFPGKGMFLMWGAPALLNILMGGTKRARSLKDLAEKCGVDADNLDRSVTLFNQSVAAGSADVCGKAIDKMQAVAKGPFYAVNLSLTNRFGPSLAFTLGGLVVSEATGEVRRTDGSVVYGLYAAGRAAVGICSRGYMMSGQSIADTVFSGRRAGRDAARKVNRGDNEK